MGEKGEKGEKGEQDINPTDSAVLKASLGPYWRWWSWVCRQFTPASLSAIGAIAVGCGSYIAHLRESVVQVRERVVVLETKVIPFVEGETKVATIAAVLSDHEGRIRRLEDQWDDAKNEAAAPPPISPRRRQ